MGRRVTLTELRESCADMARRACPDVAVIDHLPDTIPTPCIMFAWGDPMLEPDTFGDYLARAALIVLVARRGLDPQLARVEDMVHAIAGEVAKSHDWTRPSVTPPRPFKLSGVVYTAAFVQFENATGCDLTT